MTRTRGLRGGGAMVQVRAAGLFAGYDPALYYDEMFEDRDAVRRACAPLSSVLAGWSQEEFDRPLSRANLTFQQSGITFTVYGDARGTERLIPFAPIPRVKGDQALRAAGVAVDRKGDADLL